MDYKIVRADAEIGQIEVVYKDADGAVVGVYAIDVPIIDGAFLSGTALHDEIMHRAPLWQIDRKKEVAEATGFDAIAALVDVTDAQVLTSTPAEVLANAEMWKQVEFERQLGPALVKFGLLEANPATIGVTSL